MRGQFSGGHTITGCDTVSAILKIGKRAALCVLKLSECPDFGLFKGSDTRYDFSNAVEVSLDSFCYFLYVQKMKSFTLTSFQSFPPILLLLRFILSSIFCGAGMV